MRADLAEYYARTKRAPAALAEIAILASARLARIHRIAIVYELTANRKQAIAAIAGAVRNPATLRQIQDDPDLAALWADPALQAILPPRPDAPPCACCCNAPASARERQLSEP